MVSFECSNQRGFLNIINRLGTSSLSENGEKIHKEFLIFENFSWKRTVNSRKGIITDAFYQNSCAENHCQFFGEIKFPFPERGS